MGKPEIDRRYTKAGLILEILRLEGIRRGSGEHQGACKMLARLSQRQLSWLHAKILHNQNPGCYVSPAFGRDGGLKVPTRTGRKVGAIPAL